MALTCGGNCARVSLIILNTVFLVIGLGFLGVGIWLVVDNSALQVLRFAIGIVTTADLVWGAAVIVIVISIFVIFIAGVGFYGSFSSNTCCIGFYSAILVILLVLQAIGLILIGVFYSQINTKMARNMNDTLQVRYGKAEYGGTTKGWNFLQTEIFCCGVKRPLDWSTSWWKNQTSTKNVPDQCCVLVKKDFRNPQPVDPVKCQDAAYDENYPDRHKYINAKGCEQKVEDWMDSYFAIILGVIGGLFVIQVMIVCLACCLKSAAKKNAYEPM